LVSEFGVLLIATSEISTLFVPLLMTGGPETTATSCDPVVLRRYSAPTWVAMALAIAATVPDGGVQFDHGGPV